MTIRQITDRNELVLRFQKEPAVHIYGLGDLDEPFWSRSRWFTDEISIVGLVSLPDGSPTRDDMVMVYAISATRQSHAIRLLLELAPEIPNGALALAPVGSAQWMRQLRSIEDLGQHLTLGITKQDQLSDFPDVISLGSENLCQVEDLYRTEPGAAFFLAEMLERGLWGGILIDGELISVGGTHLYSTKFNCAGLGGIYTHPSHRGHGRSAQVTSWLTSSLLDRGVNVGLHVRTANLPARRLYAGLGFAHVQTYEEFIFLDANERRE